MKKIFFLLLMSVGVGACVNVTDAFAAGPTCNIDPQTGEKSCAGWGTGTTIEETLCYSNTAQTDTNVWEPDGNNRWKKKVGQDCTTARKGHALALCKDNRTNGVTKRSCSAKKCLDEWLLQTTKARKDIKVVGADYWVGSQGRCVKESYIQETWCNKGCGCEKDEECVVNKKRVENFIDINNTRTEVVDAFVSEYACTCKKKTGGSTADTCEYTYNVVCKNGKDVSDVLSAYGYRYPIKRGGLTAEKLRDDPDFKKFGFLEEDIAECSGELNKSNPIHQKMHAFDRQELAKLLKDKPELFEKVDAACKSDGGYDLDGGIVSEGSTVQYSPALVVNAGNTAAINNAKAVLSAFFAKAESDVSVWKNAEGKFNIARLASDLTAGVVLGTVGGLVSSVVIKKAQVKKGFEALQCYIHGYKVADWGDVFEASLRTK